MIISLLTYSKQIAIYKLKVKKRTIKTYLQFIWIKKKLFSSTIIITIMEKQKSLSYNNILICIIN